MTKDHRNFCMESEIGKRYGRLVVVEKIDKRYFTTTIYKCRCDCGNYIDISVNKLHTGYTKSCGCLNNAIKHDLTRQRFGRLVVEEFTYRKKQYLLEMQVRLWERVFCLLSQSSR